MKSPTIFNTPLKTSHWLSQISENRKKYVEIFNGISKKEDSYRASATLFQIKEGIEKLIIDNQDSLKEKLSVIIEFLEEEIKNEEALTDLAMMLLNKTKAFHEPDLFKSGFFLNEDFRFSIESYYNKYNGEYWHISDEYFNPILELKREINSYSIEVLALTSVLKAILSFNYPKSLENLSDEELKEESNKQGRPFDKTAPQDDLKDRIIELIGYAKSEIKDYKKYWHFEGKHEGSPNKSQLIETLMHEELTGELARETVKDRVNKALNELGY